MVTNESISDMRKWADKKYSAAREKYDDGGAMSLTVVNRYAYIVDICDKAAEAMAESDSARLRRHHSIEDLIKQVPESKVFKREDLIEWMRKCIM